MSFETFLETAWNDHGDRPEEVADRLSASPHLVETPDQVAPFARLAAHVFGEHLGRWDEGVGLLESLRGRADGAEAARALDRGVAALRYAGGDGAALGPLAVEDRAAALAAAASMFTGRGELARAVTAYADADRLAAGLPEGSPAFRALAVAGNNLACALEEKAGRDEGETGAMVAAAEGGLKYWKLAGTWLEEERAEYRLARSLLRAGRAGEAGEAAARCVELCERNAAPAFERFFGYAALALARRAAGEAEPSEAARARALGLFAEVPEDERRWCESDRRELGG